MQEQARTEDMEQVMRKQDMAATLTLDEEDRLYEEGDEWTIEWMARLDHLVTTKTSDEAIDHMVALYEEARDQQPFVWALAISGASVGAVWREQRDSLVVACEAEEEDEEEQEEDAGAGWDWAMAWTAPYVDRITSRTTDAEIDEMVLRYGAAARAHPGTPSASDFRTVLLDERASAGEAKPQETLQA
jgi:hypothetical protein